MGKISKTAGPSIVGAEPPADEAPEVAVEPVYDDPPEHASADGQVDETSAGSDSADTTNSTGADDPAEGPPPAARRPPVNAAKGDHIDYGVTRYGLDRGYLDDEFNKADLVAKLTALDDDKAHIEAGRIVDGPAGPHAVLDPSGGDADTGAAGEDAETVQDADPADVDAT